MTKERQGELGARDERRAYGGESESMRDGKLGEGYKKGIEKWEEENGSDG